MLKKTVIIVVVLFTFLISSPARSAPTSTESQIADINPYCWHRRDCYIIRRTFLTGNPTDAELEKGFVSDLSTAPCNGGTGDDQWGRCLPAGVTKTEISFGGKTEFANIGEFIILMYKYLVTIASIVAVVVIIIAGMQWVTSGGNSEAISSAKKRIGGAIIGLFIAYMSYFVLNTINPALVNLHLPQVWVVRPVALLSPPVVTLITMDKVEVAMTAIEAAMVSMEKEFVEKPTATLLATSLVLVSDADTKFKEAVKWWGYVFVESHNSALAAIQVAVKAGKSTEEATARGKAAHLAVRDKVMKDMLEVVYKAMKAVREAALLTTAESMNNARVLVVEARAAVEATKAQAVAEGWSKLAE